MSAPLPLDVSLVSGPWQAVTVSGVTGTSAAAVNGTYEFHPEGDSNYGRPYYYKTSNGSTLRQKTDGTWEIFSGLVLMSQSGPNTWPWTVTVTAVNAAVTGTATLTKAYVPPGTLDLGASTMTAVAATTTTSAVDLNANAKAVIASAIPGRIGNSIRYRQVNPGVNNATASIVISGQDITFNLATGSTGAITTTGTQRNSLIASTPAAAALIVVQNLSGNTGAGIVSAFGYISPTGGQGGLPAAPQSLAV